jgi:NTE family protein
MTNNYCGSDTMVKTWALVLGGGGAKGAYQVGAWKALREYGLDKKITSVAGTSVGGLNTALFLQGDWDLAKEIWGKVDNNSILVLDKSKHLDYLKELKLKRLFTDGVFSNQGLLKMIRSHVNFDKISSSDVIAYVTCSKMPRLSLGKILKRSLEPTYFRLNGQSPEKIVSILLASSAIPFIFDPVTIEGSNYIDGGAADNLPILPLYNMGYRRFIVINLDKAQRVPREKFRDADIIEVMPDQTMAESISGVLDFTPPSIQAHIEEGYADTILTLSGRFTLPSKGRAFTGLRQLLSGGKTSGM